MTIANEAGGVVSPKKTPLKGPELPHMRSQPCVTQTDAKTLRQLR